MQPARSLQLSRRVAVQEKGGFQPAPELLRRRRRLSKLGCRPRPVAEVKIHAQMIQAQPTQAMDFRRC